MEQGMLVIVTPQKDISRNTVTIDFDSIVLLFMTLPQLLLLRRNFACKYAKDEGGL
jgi:hypothetical protein